MATEKKERSFLATLDLEDGTKLAFSKIAADGTTLETHDFLCANSLVNDTLKFYFRENDEGQYIVLLKGVLPGDSGSNSVVGKPALSDAEKIRIDRVSEFDSSEQKSYYENLPSVTKPGQDFDPETAQETAPTPTEPQPESLDYLGINTGGWVFKTKNPGVAYLAKIEAKDGQAFSIDSNYTRYVYLKSGASKQFMQTYKRQDFPNKSWFAWMTDRDGKDAVLRLTIIERYNADGSVRK